MKHQIEFDGGTVLFSLMPFSVAMDIEDLYTNDNATSRAVVALLDPYIIDVQLDAADDDDAPITSFAECPTPYMQRALEAVLGFSFPELAATVTTNTSAPTREASLSTISAAPSHTPNRTQRRQTARA